MSKTININCGETSHDISHPDPKKGGPSAKILQNYGPRMAVLGL